VLEACFAAGARLARRGEFTERAFLNGKLDLSAAEAVIDLVDARTDRAADEAQSRLRGVLSDRYESLYRDAIDCSSRMEHLLDVDEGDMPEGTMDSYANDLQDLKGRISNLLSTAREGKILREGALVVLAGRPNAGKSSLMNALLGEDRAIVSDVAGTTRDSIEEGLDVDGWPIRIVDTAGLRATDDAIEAEGVARAEELMAKADIVVALDCDIAGAIRVHAKCDLDNDAVGDAGAIRVSAKTGEGIRSLKDAIAARLQELSARSVEDVADVTARQTDLLAKAFAALDGTDPADPVLAANALRLAAQSIGEIIGKTYSDDLLDQLFSRFCVGK
jgi:tRNA modification GTPase